MLGDILGKTNRVRRSYRPRLALTQPVIPLGTAESCDCVARHGQMSRSPRCYFVIAMTCACSKMASRLPLVGEFLVIPIHLETPPPLFEEGWSNSYRVAR